jgi:mRNA interferase RelE/StbE
VYRIETTAHFDSDLRRLDRSIAARIIETIEWLAEHPQALRFPLRHVPRDLRGLHKYRVGDYRVLLWVDHEESLLTLYGVAHRRSIYRELR